MPPKKHLDNCSELDTMEWKYVVIPRNCNLNKIWRTQIRVTAAASTHLFAAIAGSSADTTPLPTIMPSTPLIECKGHTHARANTHTHIHTHTHSLIHTHTETETHTDRQTQTQTRTHALTQHTHTCTHNTKTTKEHAHKHNHRVSKVKLGSGIIRCEMWNPYPLFQSQFLEFGIVALMMEKNKMFVNIYLISHAHVCKTFWSVNHKIETIPT